MKNFSFQTKLPFIAVKKHTISMIDIRTVISSKHRLRLIYSIKSKVFTIKTKSSSKHLSTIMCHPTNESFVWILVITQSPNFQLTPSLV